MYPYMFYVSDNDDYTDETEIIINENDDNCFIFNKNGIIYFVMVMK